MKSLPIGCAVLTLWGVSFTSSDDEKSREEVKARLEAFNDAWEARDLDFIRNFYAHDPEMLLFFERRQLRGWSQVETLYQNMFESSRRGAVESTYTNLKVDARGDMGYVAANFDLEVTEPGGEVTRDILPANAERSGP